MKIELLQLKIRDVVENYKDLGEEGVTGYNGKLDIRPKYQREYVYKEKQRDAVIDTIFKGYPLNVMYWAKKDDGTYEVLDGQQRTISFCQYASGVFSFSVNGNIKAFHNLTEVERQRFLDYELMIYVCDGNDIEKLEWFKVINIAGLELKPQELLNAVYSGPWLSHAKIIFSKTGCAAFKLSKDYVKAEVDRQGLLEIALKWMSKGNIEEYMSVHQHDPNANELWMYFQNVINWVKITLPNTRKEMKTVNWGYLYDNFHDKMYDTKALEKEISSLMMDDDVTKKSGIYPYIFTREEKYLSIRSFSDTMKREAYEHQKGLCIKCGEHFEYEEMEGDHIIPWSKGGKTTADNCQMLCKKCNATKSNK